MNDRFKFRIWDKIHKKYIYCDFVGFCSVDKSGKGLKKIIFRPSGIDQLLNDGKIFYANEDDVIIEQCTGQKDNKERLIFENDIMKNVYSDKVRYLVSWINNAWKLKVYSKENGYIDLMNLPIDIKDFEVIGNIHENHDMLKNPENFNTSGGNVKGDNR